APERDEILLEAVEAANDTEGADLADVLPLVLQHVAGEDLIERTPQDLAGAVAALYSLARQRRPGQALVRVLSPHRDHDGWTSPHSVVLVCTDDMPFLVDSVTAAVGAEGLGTHLVVHPQLSVTRNAEGGLEQVSGDIRATTGSVESWMYLEVDRLPDEARRAALGDAVERVLADVRKAVEDWQPMRRRALSIVSELAQNAPETVDLESVGSAREFLTWLTDDHFTFLGYREYSLEET